MTKSLLAFATILSILTAPLASRGDGEKADTGTGTARTNDVNRGLFFDQVKRGVNLPPMQLDYDLSQNDGKTLILGDVSLNSSTFLFAFVSMGRVDSRLGSILTSEESARPVLVMRWPEALFKRGTLEMISRTGTVLWKMDFTKEIEDKWKARLQEFQEAFPGAKDKKDLSTGMFANQYVEEDVKGRKIPFFDQKENFRFCLTQTEGHNQGRLCSRWYATRTTGKKVVMGPIPVDPVTPRVLIENAEAPLKASLPVPKEMPVRFFAELRQGETYDFVSRPDSFELMDIVTTPQKETVRVIGTNTPPTTHSSILNPDDYGNVTKILGFEATIGDTRKFWLAQLPVAQPQLYFPGVAGGIFTQKFELNDVPTFRARPYISRRTPLMTYTDDFKIFGRKLPKAELVTDQNSVYVDPDEPENFTWYFRATERGEINRSYLDVKYRGKTYRSYYEVYKGYPRELSARMSGILSSSGVIVMGEVAYNQWFETLLGWTNYWVGRQRWGVSAKYFRSMNQIAVDAVGTKATLTVTTADIKYRLNPGLWGRDESLGLIGSYQSVVFGELKSPVGGVGAFWARSMPRIFDDLFNYLPYMSYPKWVDMEFIYYGMSLDSKIQLETNFALNFHGKVMWTKNFFGEAGFGLKRYAFIDTVLNQKAELNTVYGTVGLGLSF